MRLRCAETGYRCGSMITLSDSCAAANNGLVIAANATQILLGAGVSNDREHIRGLIYSTIYHNKRFFKKERPGYYRLVESTDNQK